MERKGDIRSSAQTTINALKGVHCQILADLAGKMAVGSGAMGLLIGNNTERAGAVLAGGALLIGLSRLKKR